MEQSLKSFFLVFIGGGFGSIVRYYLSVRFDQNFPLGTFFANILGCLIIGFAFGLFEKNIIENQTKLLLVVGFCGGFTTFSSFILQKYQMALRGEYFNFILYSSSSILVGLFCLVLGIYFAKLILN